MTLLTLQRVANLVRQPSACFVGDATDLVAPLWQTLPVEIVHEILTVLACSSHSDALTLTLVSSSVRRVVLPVIYRSVILCHPRQVALFSAPFVPRRRPSFFARPDPPGQRLSAHASIRYLALCFSPKLPSLEQTLADVADSHVFDAVKCLALTAPLLSAHAFWLRRHPAIRPHTLMLFHQGHPQPINFRAPCLSNVHTLYTSTLHGFGGSTPADLPHLRRLAVTSRAFQPPESITAFLLSLHVLLASAPHIETLVFCLTARSGFRQDEIEPWRTALAPLRHHGTRLIVLPFSRPARLEWADICAGADPPPVFALAATLSGDVIYRAAAAAAVEEAEFKAWSPGTEWDLDVHPAPWYVHASLW